MPPDRQLCQGRLIAEQHAQPVYRHGCQDAACQPADTARDRLLRAHGFTQLRPADRAAGKQGKNIAQQGHSEGQAQQHHLHRFLVRQQADRHEAQARQRHRQQRQRAHAQVRQLRLFPEQDHGDHNQQRQRQQRNNRLHTEKDGQRNRCDQRNPRRPGHHPVSRGCQGMVFLPDRKADADQRCQRHAPVRQPKHYCQENHQQQSGYKSLFHGSLSFGRFLHIRTGRFSCRSSARISSPCAHMRPAPDHNHAP